MAFLGRFFLSFLLASFTTAQITDYVPLGSVSEYRVLEPCPQTYISRVVDKEVTHFLCERIKRTAEYLCKSRGPDSDRLQSVAGSVYSAVSAICVPNPYSASTAKSALYRWCDINSASSVADSLDLDPTGSSSAVAGPLSNPATTTLATSTTAATASTPTESSNVGDSPENNKGDGGLSADGKASLRVGIGVGVSVGLLTIIVMIIIYILEQRRRRSPVTSQHPWDNAYVSVINVTSGMSGIFGRREQHYAPGTTQSRRSVQNLEMESSPR